MFTQAGVEENLKEQEQGVGQVTSRSRGGCQGAGAGTGGGAGDRGRG